MNVLIVESPAKAKTIEKYLGKDFKVIASFGHVRDFPAKNGSVDPNNDFAMKYEVIAKSERYVDKLAKAVNKASNIYLATDPDREGEAISWHIIETLKERNAINDNSLIKRVVFNEITKNAVINSIKEPRDINIDLVKAQQARRALDYLVGFTLSPVLWRKLPGSKSAGRVQSVALRLICEKEEEIDKFTSQEYWDIKAILRNSQDDSFSSTFSHHDGKKIDKFYIKSEEDAKNLVDIIISKSYSIIKVINKEVKRNPYPPFITSTLQQDAANKLGFSARNTMAIAQKLYEGIDVGGETVGLITYMRTDGLYIADEAITFIRNNIVSLYGGEYLPKSVRKYAKKIKNAQEAHEAIRPTDISLTPKNLINYLTSEQLKLYDLIWRRTIASQMESALIAQVSVDLVSEDKIIGLHSAGSTIKFDGFYRVYHDSEVEDDVKKLPMLSVGEHVILESVLPKQHFTQPPSRFTEAGLVKKMEEVGIGRPSTYAMIISVLQDRKYAILEQRKFVPSERGRIVNAFLTDYFSHYVEYNFTAALEEELDLIASGKIEWKQVLRQFWQPFILNINAVKKLEYSEIMKKINISMEKHIFPLNDDGSLNKKCPLCNDQGELSINTGRNGIFLGCSNYPNCKYIKNIENGSNDCETQEFPKIMGVDSTTNEELYLKKGPYGMYLQLGESKKGKSVALPKSIDYQSLTFETAMKLVSLPICLGDHPETLKKVKLGIGKFGPYILYDSKYYSLKTTDDSFINVTLEDALSVINSIKVYGAVKVLGQSSTGEDISIYKGKYGMYLKCGKKNFALKNMNVNEITLSEALNIIDKNPK